MTTMAPTFKVEPRYQYFPAMLDTDFERLKESIAQHGFDPEKAVVLDEDGRILDGHHRAKACAEMGIECPTRTRAGLTEQEKDDFIWRENMIRRHIPLAERLTLVRHRLRAKPEESDRAVARDVGVRPETVAKQRDELEKVNEIGQFRAEGGRGRTTGEPIPWQSWPRCEVCDAPSDPKKAVTSDDGRQGHRKCLEPGVGADVAQHRAGLRLIGTLEYPLPDEYHIHERPTGEHPREKEWREMALDLVLPGAAPTNARECQMIGKEIGDQMARLMHRELLTITDHATEPVEFRPF